VVTDDKKNTIKFSTNLNGAEVVFEYELFESTTHRKFGDVSFKLDSADVKLTLNITDWPWLASTNELKLTLDLSSHDGKILKVHETEKGNEVIYNFTTANTQTILKLFTFGLDSAGNKVQAAPSLSMDKKTLTIIFAHFKKNLLYDPDINVLLQGSTSDSNNSLTTILAAVLVPSLTVPFFLVFLIIAVLVVLYFIRKWRRSQLLNETTPSGKRPSSRFETFEMAAEKAENDV